MKHSNLVIGEQVQVKRTHICERGDTYLAGRVYSVHRIDDDGEFWMNSPDFGLGKGINVAENFRKYKEPEQEPQQEVTHQYKVGDMVVVGAKGAGYGEVLPEYADKVCTITEVDVFGQSKLVKITHPDVREGAGYTSMLKYLTPHVVAKALKEYDVVQLTHNCVARHGEDIKHGLFEVAIDVEASEDYVTVLTGQGWGGQATLPLEYVHRYKEQDDGQA